VEVRGPSSQRVMWSAKADDCDGVEVSAQVYGGRWRLVLSAQTPEQVVRVGAVLVDFDPTRRDIAVVMVASVPGAVHWMVDCEPVGVGENPQLHRAEVILSAGCCSEAFRARNGAREEVFAYAAGVAGLVAVPAGQRVTGWAAWASAPGATASIDGGPAIPLPVGAVQGSPVGLQGGASFLFVGTDGYLVELAEAV
jgi:hypothetical protein